MKVAIVVAVWKRPEIFELFANGLNEMMKINSVEWKVIVVGSEGKQSKDMVKAHGYDYIEQPNQPLAKKMNSTLPPARKWGADYILWLGSDDILSPNLMELMISYMNQGYDFIGILDFFIYDSVSKKAFYWGGYADKRVGQTGGAGRCLSSNLLDQWDWDVWANKYSHILDTSMDVKLKETKHSYVNISIADEGLMAVDIKSSTNMTPFKLWPNSVYINPNIITDILCVE